jgi:FkbM family methyltransferase
MTTEIHPSFRARVMRGLRAFTNMRGWRRAATAIAGSHGNFSVANQGQLIEGSMGSLIERQSYLFGGYERDQIGLFLSAVPKDRRGTILDIGANVGTHSLRFSQAFERVLSFEPSPLVIDRLRRNVALNPDATIHIHNVGLGDAPGEFDLFAPAGANQGLGTFLTDEQYDRPLEKVGVSRIEIGDDYIAVHAPGRIDAIKCDVQGFEVQVFRGLQQTVARDRPILWIEIGSGAHTVADEIAALLPLLPRPARYYRMSSTNLGPITRATLIEAQENELDAGDWVIVPQ